MKSTKKDKLLYTLKSEYRSRLKPLENELDIGGIKSYLFYLETLLKGQAERVNCNIIRREINSQIERLAELEKSMRHVGVYLADIGRWLHMEGYAKETDLDRYLTELKKYSLILIKNAESRKKTV